MILLDTVNVWHSFPPRPAAPCWLLASSVWSAQFLHPVLQSEEEEGAALMSVYPVADLFSHAQAAFGVILPIKAELASGISTCISCYMEMASRVR